MATTARTVRRRVLTVALPCAIMLGAPVALAAQATTVILVRHAERVDDSRDSELSAAGHTRAEALAAALADAKVSAIYTSQYRRTQQTAAPLARRLGIEPHVVAAGSDIAADAHAVAERIRSGHSGHAVLIVGHGNTVPALLRAFGGPEIPEIPSVDYDQMYVVILSPDAVRVVRASLTSGPPPR